MPAPLSDLQIKAIFNVLHANGTTLLELITSVLKSTDCEACQAAEAILLNPQVILETIRSHLVSQLATQQWAWEVIIEICHVQVLELTKEENRLHFTAKNMTEKRLQEFGMESAPAQSLLPIPHQSPLRPQTLNLKAITLSLPQPTLYLATSTTSFLIMTIGTQSDIRHRTATSTHHPQDNR